MLQNPLFKKFIPLFFLFCSFNLLAETLVIFDVADKTAKIHPDVVKGSKEYLSKLLSGSGKYSVIPDAAFENLKKSSPKWMKCGQMECQIEIGKALKADVVVVPTVEYFAGIFTLTVNYIYVDGKRKTEAGATDFNGTAVGMKKALEAVVSTIQGKKAELPVFVEKNVELEKYKAENFKQTAKKDYVVPVEPLFVSAPPKIVPGSVSFTSDKQGIRVVVDITNKESKSCVVPCSIKELSPGTHTVRYELAKHMTKDETIEILPGKEIAKNVTLVPIIKSLEEINNELISATKTGNLQLVKELLDKGANVNCRDKADLSPLLIAVLSGNREAAAYLIGRGAKFSSVETGTLMLISVEKDDAWIASLVARQKATLNITFGNGETILWIAAKRGAWKAFDEYVKGGINLNIKNSSGETIVAWATNNGQSEVIKRLSRVGAARAPSDLDKMIKQAVTNEDIEKLETLLLMKPNVNKVYDDGLTLLWYSAVKDRPDIAEALLKSGALPNVNDKSGRPLLTYCVETHRYEMAKLLQKYGAAIKNSDGIQLLQRGLVIGDTELVQLLVQLKVNVNIKFSDGLTALWVAAFTNNREMVNVLADSGANLNTKDKHGRTVLMWAVENDKKEIANTLITRGANVNLMDNKKKTALISAVIADKPRMVHMLVKNGAQIDLKDSEGNSPVLVAAAKGNLTLVKLFIEHGAFINTADANGNTPLLISLHKNFDDVVEYLLEKGAEINKTNKIAETPLIVAARKGHIRFVKSFIDRGAAIDLQDKNGETALIHAKRENRREVVFYLLNKNALIEKRSEEDEMVAYGVLNSYHEIVENLIQRGISVNRRFSDGLFPLWYAVRNGDIKMIDVLLAAKADLEAKNKEGETVLLYACAKREEHIVVNLLNKGANFTVTDKQKSSPLIIVAGRGFAKAVQILISKKADLNAKDDKGRTALIRARYTGNYNIVDMLKRAGAYE